MLQYELLKQVTYDFAESEQASIFSPHLESSKRMGSSLASCWAKPDLEPGRDAREDGNLGVCGV